MKNQTNTPKLPGKGLLNDVVSEMIQPLPSKPISRILVVGCAVKIHFPWDLAKQRYQNAVKEVETAVQGLDIEVISDPEPFEDADALVKFATEQKSGGLAAIVFFHAAYTAGEIGSQFGRWLLDNPLPILSWAWPEPGNGDRNEANSLTCQNFILGMWKQMGVDYAWMHKPITEEAQPLIGRFARAAYARDQFNQAKILHAGGSRVTAFYDGEVDELAVMKSFGVRFDRVDLEAVYQHGKKFTDTQLSRLVDTLVNNPRCERVDVPVEQMKQTYRFGLAILDMASEQGYLGATVKSWPDLFDCYDCAIDGSVSMMNDFGFCVAEEGEMNGALSSLALQLVSADAAIPTMMDLSLYNEPSDTLGIWHCGASPTRLMRKNTSFAATRHSILENGDPETAVGLMLEFLLELGDITVLRYQSPKAQQYYCFEGKFVETELAYRGSYGLMVPKDGQQVRDIIGTILSKGLDHHWSVGYGHWNEEIKLLNHFLKIEEIRTESFSESFGVHS